MAPKKKSVRFGPQEYGPALRFLREKLRLTLEEVAAMAGVKHATLSRYETGKRGVSDKMFDRLVWAIDDAREQRRVALEQAQLAELLKCRFPDSPLHKLGILLKERPAAVIPQGKGTKKRGRPKTPPA